MVADCITTSIAKRAQFGFHPIWLLFLPGPMGYHFRELTVRLGAVTKRGH
jgi:Mn2+/Fe2+ NRAMP family transporter